jgi:hypothetical protein
MKTGSTRKITHPPCMNPTVKTAFGMAKERGIPRRRFACMLLEHVNAITGKKKKCDRSWHNTVYRWATERAGGGYTWPIYEHEMALKTWINTNK